MNVLLLTTDQQRADTLGVYGSPLGVTPRLDALASQGTRFDLCLCQHPYCQPSRWSLLTGQTPRRHGVWTNGIDPSPVQLAHALSTRLTQQGYDTALIGKAHFASNGVFSKRASEHAETFARSRAMDPSWHGPYMGFSHAELVQLGHFPMGYGPKSLHYGRFLASHSRFGGLENFLRASPLGGSYPRPRAPQTWFSGLPEELHPTTWITDRALAWLGARSDKKPFFLWVSYPDPHHPLDPPTAWAQRVAPDAVPRPVRKDGELQGKPPWQRRFSEGVMPGSELLNAPAGKLSEAQLAVMSAAYHALVALVDKHVGRLLDGLRGLGLDEETLVLFTTDHGELLGDHGLLFKGPFHYDGLVRVPLLVKGPGVPVGQVVRCPVEQVDLRPTVEEFLGLSPAEECVLDGRSLWPVLRGEVQRTEAVCENDHRIVFHEHVQTLVTETHKLNVHVGKPYGELYVRQDDPGELDNRWDDPALALVRRELMNRLRTRLPPWTLPRRSPVTWFPA